MVDTGVYRKIKINKLFYVDLLNIVNSTNLGVTVVWRKTESSETFDFSFSQLHREPGHRDPPSLLGTHRSLCSRRTCSCCRVEEQHSTLDLDWINILELSNRNHLGSKHSGKENLEIRKKKLLK